MKEAWPIGNEKSQTAKWPLRLWYNEEPSSLLTSGRSNHRPEPKYDKKKQRKAHSRMEKLTVKGVEIAK